MKAFKTCAVALGCSVVCLSTVVFAEQNYYCGKGKDKFIVDEAEYALVLSDDNTFYMRGQKQDNLRILSLANGEYKVVQANDPKNDGLTLLFSACRNSKAVMDMTSNFTLPGRVSCTCEQM